MKTSWKQSIDDFTQSRRRLPHLEIPGGFYFTTSTTFDRWILPDNARDIIATALHYHDGAKYELDAYVVMPDHLHVILHPLQSSDGAFNGLREIFHSLKSYSAKQIVKSVSDLPKQHYSQAKRIKTHVWQDENFDHLIRNEKDYIEKLWYLINNPVEAGLVDDPFDYPWLWVKHGPVAKHNIVAAKMAAPRVQ